MWGIDEKAGTMAMNPWNSVAQAPNWDIGRGNAGQPTFSGARVAESRGGARTWMDHQAMQVPVGQWNPPPSQWPIPPNQQAWPMQQAWGQAANSPNGTYAEQTKKTMAPIRGQAINGRYDQQQQAWGGMKVDQQTPWDTGTGPSLHAEHKGDWGANFASASQWGVQPQWPPGPRAAAPEWAHRHEPAGAAHWTPHPSMVPTGVTGASWGQPQPPLSTPSDQYDPNPQTPGPWVAPQPTEMNNDMMWHDPNPKQKKVQRDTGTSVWGDPNAQQAEIRRWKDADQEDYSHVHCAAATGGDWSNIPVSSVPVGTNTSPPAPAGGWIEPQPAHTMNTVNDGTERWGAVLQTGGWGEPMKTSADVQLPSNTELPMPAGTANAENSIIDTMRPAENSNTAHSALTQQIADQLRIAVTKGLIDVSLIRQQLPQSALIILNTILQKAQKLEQAQQEYAQLIRNSTNATNAAQKMEQERLAVEIENSRHEIIQHRSALNELLMKARSQVPVNGIISLPSDGQSRLNQWKQANHSDGNPSEKIVTSASDGNVSALAAATGNLSLDDKVDWKRGTLDWSPPSGGSAVERPSVEGSNALEKDEGSEKISSSKVQIINGTPSPKMDDGPQEFVPGKKWEWRDPNKVAEDPNATPGNCKPNPLLSTSSSNASFQMSYGQAVTQGNVLNENNVNKVTFMGWNGVPPYNNEMYGRNRPPSNAGQPFTQRVPGGHAAQTGFSRSMSSPNQQHFQTSRWILIQSHGQNDQQIQMLAQKAGKLVQFFAPPTGGPFWGLKFVEPAETVVERMKVEVPFLQPKIVSDVELERAFKLRGQMPINSTPAGWGPVPGPGVDANGSWGFPGPVVPGDLVQQHIFQIDDLSRQY